MTDAFRRSEPDLFETSLDALRTGLRFARGYLFNGEEALDAELVSREDMPMDEVLRLLLVVRQDTGFTEEELRLHSGEPPIPADRQSHVIIAAQLRRAYPSCYVVGEEATEAELEAAASAGPGALIFAVDAIDGSRPYDTLTFGFSTNLLAYRRQPDFDDLQLAMIVNSSELVISYESGGGVRVGTLDQQRLISEPLSVDPRMDTVAAVCAKYADRAPLAFLTEDPTLTVFTTGGAPAAIGLVAGRLAALVCAKPQSTHDAAYLPVLASLGLPIFLRDGTAISLPDVLTYFSRLARSPESPGDKPVPAFVAGRNPQLTFDLALRMPDLRNS